MRCFAITVLLCIGACLGNPDIKASDDPIINGNNVTDAPVTEVNPPSVDPPVPAPSTTTTIAPITTSLTTATPNITTHKPDPTTTKPSPTTTTPPPPPTTVTTTKPTIAPTSPSSTTPPITTTASPHHERKFDGPSFIGGIILALGLVAIGFVAFKFYKARTEQNYHTL